jgi:hypothetical protein
MPKPPITAEPANTSAGRLREAAQKIREMAEPAGRLPAGWFKPAPDDVVRPRVQGGVIRDHIVVWSPPVALAVADWLEVTAVHIDPDESMSRSESEVWFSALNVAEGILREQT